MNRRKLLWLIKFTPVSSRFRLQSPDESHLPQLVAELEATYRYLIPPDITLELRLESPKLLVLEVGGIYLVCHRMARSNHWSAGWERVGIAIKRS